MHRAVSSYLFVSQGLNRDLLDKMAAGGAEAIEIFGARQHFDYTDNKYVKEVASWFRSNPTYPHSMHSPLYRDYDWGRSGTPPVNIVADEKRIRIESMDEIKRAIECAEQIPFRYLIQHVGDQNEAASQAKFDFLLTAVEHLRAFAKPLGVTLLLENTPNETSQPAQLREALTTGHFDDVGFCFDFGHAHMAGGIRPAFEIMRDHILSTHVHDNPGDIDNHLWPGEGTIEWAEAMKLLQDAPKKPTLLLEINGDNDTPEGATGKLAKAFSMLESQNHAAE